ncbi:intraflagellar transport protein 88 homolog [Homalodisca vitripennis]|uniref:intraflagellar transport protein 88 homolog n=1 Tax=Homalodisca vitripennis TaxID=197043 RepID=UPI001EEBC26F|nr:intraflagellar transport protein 88 homolog [Homalodisca vitripennis]
METIRFVPDDEEEDLYSGFNDFPSALFNTKNLDQDEFVQMALRSSYSKRPGLVSSKPGTAMRFWNIFRETISEPDHFWRVGTVERLRKRWQWRLLNKSA